MTLLASCAANLLWYLTTLPEALAFRAALGSMEESQHKLLMETLRRNAGTEYGSKHGFASITGVAEFQARVPLADYADLEPYLARVAAGERNLLTAEPVLLLEPTGGSSGGAKLIPYTKGLKRQFQRGIAPWIADLYRNHPALFRGESYWSVTPAAQGSRRTSGGIPIGFDDDSDYAGPLGRLLVGSLQAVPDEVKRIDRMESFWYVTLLFLLRSRRLALISVWNPTFLTLLTGHLADSWRQLADDVAAGTLTPPYPLDPVLARSLARRLSPDRRRAHQIRAACSGSQDPSQRHRALWPRLRLISCWCDAAAAQPAEELRRLFPQALIQGKGLIATEGFSTLPLTAAGGCLPALRSHFFEFLPLDGGPPRLVHQLNQGESYALLLTTGGGLYRYRTHDLVQVTGFRHGVPLLRFVGREGAVSDRFGEKLHEGHVCRVLEQAAGRCQVQPSFAMLAFEPKPQPAYALCIEAAQAEDGELLRIGALVDELLGENFHYRYCRDLGQLAPLRVFRIQAEARAAYARRCVSLGQRLGDVKPLALHRLDGWTETFQGRLLHPEDQVSGLQN